jgi:hypothetical protein
MVGEYYVIWIERKKPPLVREGLEYDYRRQFSRYILPKFASCELAQVTPKLLEAFRTYLLTELGLSLKSCRNIIDGTFRAMMRDARIIDQLIDKKIHSSFSVGPGSDVQSRIPSPRKNGTKFSRRSKAKIPFTTRLSIRSFGPECGRRKRLHFAGEMLTFRQRRISITKSRHLGAENETKTRASERTIRILPGVAALLRSRKPLHVTETDYVFRNQKDNPIDEDKWRKKHWYRTLRAAGVSEREVLRDAAHIHLGRLERRRKYEVVG